MSGHYRLPRYSVGALPRTAFSAEHYRVPRYFFGILPRTTSFCGSSTALLRRRGSTTAAALGPPRQTGLPHYRVPRYFVGALPRTALFCRGTTAYRVILSGVPFFLAEHYRVPRYFFGILPRTASFCGGSTALPRRRGSTTAAALEQISMFSSSLRPSQHLQNGCTCCLLSG